MMTTTMSHPMERTSRTMGLIILTMDQPEIVVIIIQGMMMFLTHTLGPHQTLMKIAQDPMTQQKSNTQQKTQDWESKMRPKTTQEWKSEIKPKTT